jgi:hypothetical protein
MVEKNQQSNKEKIIIRKVEWLGLLFISSLLFVSFYWVVHALIEPDVVLFWLSLHVLIFSILFGYSLRTEFIKYYEIEARELKP